MEEKIEEVNVEPTNVESVNNESENNGINTETNTENNKESNGSVASNNVEKVDSVNKKGKKLKKKKRADKIAEIKADPEKRKKSKKYGFLTLGLCLLSLLLIYPMTLVAIAILKFAFSKVIFVLLGNIILILFGLSFPLLYVCLQVYLFIFAIAQLSIRKDWFGWVCLAITIITVLAVIVLCFLSFFGIIGGAIAP